VAKVGVKFRQRKVHFTVKVEFQFLNGERSSAVFADDDFFENGIIFDELLSLFIG
jgi:hypothetical protein